MHGRQGRAARASAGAATSTPAAGRRGGAAGAHLRVPLPLAVVFLALPGTPTPRRARGAARRAGAGVRGALCAGGHGASVPCRVYPELHERTTRLDMVFEDAVDHLPALEQHMLNHGYRCGALERDVATLRWLGGNAAVLPDGDTRRLGRSLRAAGRHAEETGDGAFDAYAALGRRG